MTKRSKDGIRVTPTHYIIDGGKYDRVTSVLDYYTPPSMIKWMMKEGKSGVQKRQKVAKSVGTRVHGCVQKYFVEGRYKLTANDGIAVRNCMKAFDDWVNTNHPVMVSAEKTIWSPDYMIAGTPDIETDTAIIDVKTSEAIRFKYWLQVAVYARLKGKQRIGILRLDKMMGEYELQMIDYDEKLFQIFLGLLIMYRCDMSYSKKGVLDVDSTHNQIRSELGLEGSEDRYDWSKRNWEI